MPIILRFSRSSILFDYCFVSVRLPVRMRRKRTALKWRKIGLSMACIEVEQECVDKIVTSFKARMLLGPRTIRGINLVNVAPVVFTGP